MRKFGIFCVFSFIAMGAAVAQVAEKRVEYAATDTEVYALGKLKADGESLRDAQARLREAQARHDLNLRAFVSDAAKGHQIALKQGQTLGLTEDGRSFYVMDEIAPIVSR